MISSGFFICDVANNPIILSASLIAEISAVVTTNALSAPAIAFLKPCSIPAGQSIKIKSNSSLNLFVSSIICSSFTALLSRVCAAGNKNNSLNLLSFISACLNLHLPSTTSQMS